MTVCKQRSQNGQSIGGHCPITNLSSGTLFDWFARVRFAIWIEVLSDASITYSTRIFQLHRTLYLFRSMGSTRFFKVARVRSDEGFVVVKVFVKHDPSLPLELHAKRLEFIKKNLSNAVNCLPFQRVEVWNFAKHGRWCVILITSQFLSFYYHGISWRRKRPSSCVNMWSTVCMIAYRHGHFWRRWKRSGSHSKCCVHCTSVISRKFATVISR